MDDLLRDLLETKLTQIDNHLVDIINLENDESENESDE